MGACIIVYMGSKPVARYEFSVKVSSKNHKVITRTVLHFKYLSFCHGCYATDRYHIIAGHHFIAKTVSTTPTAI